MFTQVPRVFYQHPRRCHHRGSSWSKTNCTRAVCISHFALNLRINSSAEWMIWNDMKWYEMIWNDMKWKKSSYARIPRCPKSMMWHSVTLCAEKCAGAGTGFHGAANYGPDALDAELKSENLQFSLTWSVGQFVGPKEYQENPREA